MARALRLQYPNAHYHVTCRGNEQRRIFIDERDYELFLEKLSLSLETYNVILYVYVCMDNHFHFELSTPDANLSEFMRHFNISYTSIFNWRHWRVGHLYQGRYKAFLIDEDNYLLEVSRYVHLNPARGKLAENINAEEKRKILQNYRWSSLPGYLDIRRREGIINYKKILEHFGGDNRRGREAYRRFILQGLGEEIKNPLELAAGHGIVGEEAFIKRIKEQFAPKRISKREQPAAREFLRKCTPLELIELYGGLIGMGNDELCRRGKKSVERAMLMEFLYRNCLLTQPQIGALLGGIDYSAVSQARRRLRQMFVENPQIGRRFKELGDRLAGLSRIKI